MYTEDMTMTFDSIARSNDNERFSRVNNDDPSSFFTNEYC